MANNLFFKKNLPYHSGLNSGGKKIGCFAKLSFRTKFPGPIRSVEQEHLRQEDPQGLDIIDETLYFFRANIFFSTYEICSDADRNLVYLTLYIIECLKTIYKAQSRKQAQQELSNLAQQRFALPGEPKFPLNALYALNRPQTSTEAEELRSYLTQMRQECGSRLLTLAWPDDPGSASKWWICFAKRRFLKYSLDEVSLFA